MRQKVAASPQGMRTAGPGKRISYGIYWPFSRKMTVAAAGSMVLLAVVAFGVTRQAATTGPLSASELTRPAARLAFTRAEEAYIQALWPIHGEVERTTARLSLGKIFYKTNDLGKADLKLRVNTALATYRQADGRISELQPPPSLAQAHENYREAVRLFEQSAVEVLKMFDDGDDEHLLVAYPLSHEGTNKIREIGARFWQDEFPPN